MGDQLHRRDLMLDTKSLFPSAQSEERDMGYGSLDQGHMNIQLLLFMDWGLMLYWVN